MKTGIPESRGDETEVERLIRDGDEHIRQGQGSEADECFRQALERCPDHPVALHRRGFLALLRGVPREAVAFLSSAAAIRGDNAVLRGHLASAHMAAGNVDQAIEQWKRALELAPDFPGAHIHLGEAHSAKGEMESAETAYRRAVELAPEDPRGFAGLARVLIFTGRSQEGEVMLRDALERSKGAPEAMNPVGAVLLEIGALDAALELFEASSRHVPDDARGHAGRGIALQMLGRGEEAEAAYREALRLDPKHALALKHLGVLLQERGELDAAAECFETLLQSNPDDDVARHMLAATRGEMTPGAPDGYVTRLFDDYADRFDAHLQQIAYRVPALIRAAIVEVAGSDPRGLRILDLGCGTGLCGEALRPFAAYLAGIDLSPRMVAKCRARHVYDSLAVQSIDEALEGQDGTYDLIVAGDVFTYVGDLGHVMGGCARALRPGGLMAFSVEDTDGDGYRLRPTGRFAHSQAYVAGVAATAGLSIAYERQLTLRDDQNPVPGRILVLSNSDPGDRR